MRLDGYRNAEDTRNGPMIFRPRKLLDPLSRIGNSYGTKEIYRLNIEEAKRLRRGFTPIQVVGVRVYVL